jgi:hypothetical protein
MAVRSFLLLFGCVFFAHAQSIDVKKVAPLGITRGQKVVISFTGSKVETASSLWTSFPAAAMKVSQKPGEAQFAVTCYESAELGIGAMQLVGRSGASAWRLVVVDDLPVQAIKGSNRKQDEAQLLNVPAAVDSVTGEDSADYYKFKAQEGENFSIEIVAHRIGSAMDPAVIVMDENSRELFFSDDADGSKDTRFRFAAPRSGTYILQVRDIGFAGGENYVYRLRMGDFPLASFVLPRKNGGLEFVGPHIERGQLNKKHGGLMPGTIDIKASAFDLETADSEAPLVELPATIFGRFDTPGDHDHFRFKVAEGERLIFASHSRSFGSPCDAMLKVLTPEGELVAEANPSGPNEIALTNRFEKSGEFILQVQELAGGGGPGMAYTINVEKNLGGFTLAAENPFIEAVAGGLAPVKISCTRFDYDGPIELFLYGAGEGVRLENNFIGKGKNETELKLILSDEWETGQSVRFRIEGQGRGTSSALVSTTASLKKLWPLMLYPPRELDGLFSLTVK